MVIQKGGERMSIEKTIKNLRALAQWNEDNGDLDSASEKRQIANWLQELKERREKESRQIPQDMTKEACDALVKLTEKVIEILPDIVSSVTANMPEAIEQYIESKIRNGKEESK
jgi:predicted RNase H-like HicB family nuclease